MCGRFATSKSLNQLEEEFALVGIPERELPANWNVAPTQEIYVLTEGPKLEIMRWGLQPTWAKADFNTAHTINARSESVHEKPSFRQAFRSRRCFIPADGYYEWATELGKYESKQPFFIHRKDKRALAMAGVFENGSVAIVTKEATGALATIHNRMPLFLPEDDWEMWLDSDVHDVALLRGVINQGLSPEEAELVADPVSTRVNKIANNGIELIEPIQLGEQQTLL
jgi:putative SOS response-associated peptidase YedK